MQNAQILVDVAYYLMWIVAIIVAGFTIVGGIAFWRTEKGAAKTFSFLLRRSGALEILTVVLIVFSACALRLVDAINSEGVITILGTTAGYVLGHLSKGKQEEETE